MAACSFRRSRRGGIELLRIPRPQQAEQSWVGKTAIFSRLTGLQQSMEGDATEETLAKKEAHW